jgi:branched-chain amino acid transport system ATP-binding protein
MAPAPLLSVRDLAVAYGKVEALHGIALDVAPAQIVTVIGPNGAGKTTLLSAIMGALPATGSTRGTVRVAGSVQRRLAIESMVAAGLTLVPEKRELFGDMSVEDNLRLGAWLRRRDRDLPQSLQEVYALFPRLLERRAQLAATLSGGERQMLALGRALMARPRLLLLDEPSLGLAPLIVREIFHIIVELRRRGVAILLVEQNARAALQIADYGYVLESGAIALSGPAAELAHDPRVIASYLGLGARESSDVAAPR